MAQYNELPVFKAGYDLLLRVFELTHHLNREYKFTLGEKLKNESADLLTSIYRANRVADKAAHLEFAREKLEIIRLFLRVLKDTKQLGLKQHISINENIENVSKQLAGWHKSVLKVNT